MAMDGGDYYPDPRVGDRPKDMDRTASVPLPNQTWAVSDPCQAVSGSPGPNILNQATSIIRQQTYSFDDAVQRFNQGFIESQWPLQEQLKILQKQEDERRNTILLPKTLAEFESIPKSHQIVVARTLESGGRITLPPSAHVNPSEVQALFRWYQTDVGDFKIHKRLCKD
jgi:hypothetical protein